MTNGLSLEPRSQLAVAVEASPGVHALLLGSGISSAASIPTGWQITSTLAQRLAKSMGIDVSLSATKTWFETKFATGLSYSDVVGAIGLTSDQRAMMLREFFEPTPEERLDAKKQPTAAHRAIAELVKQGYIRCIVTTNFDRLIEMALSEVGVAPSVIIHDSDVAGALPLQHSACTVVKVNGDYLDGRFRNTPAELTHYPKPVVDLLRRIFAEYALIVCGWSADYDHALRDILLKTKRRFPVFWCRRVGSTTHSVASAIHATVGDIQDADEFFMDLKERVMSVSSLRTPPPADPEVALATTKRLLAHGDDFVRLSDLVLNEALAVGDFLRNQRDAIEANRALREPPQDAVGNYESVAERLAIELVGIAYWSDNSEHQSIVVRVIEILHENTTSSTKSYDTRLLKYVTSLCITSSGIAAIAGERFGMLAALLTAPLFEQHDRKTLSAASVYDAERVMDKDVAQTFPKKERLVYAARELVSERAARVVSKVCPVERRVHDARLLFEYVSSLLEFRDTQIVWNNAAFSGGQFVVMERNAPTHPEQRLQQIVRSGRADELIRRGFGAVSEFESFVERHREMSQQMRRQIL